MRKRDIWAFIFLLILLMVALPPITQAPVSRDNFPRLEELYVVMSDSEDHMVAKALLGMIDVALHLKNMSNVDTLALEPWSISWGGGGQWNCFASGLKCWIDAYDGSDNWWTYHWLHWEDLEQTEARIGVPSRINTLNPGKASNIYEWTTLDRIYESLLPIDPFTGEFTSWLCGYVVEPWNETGQTLTIYLWGTLPMPHGPTYWHDGNSITAEDIKWNFDFIINAGFNTPRFNDISVSYYNSTVIDENTLKIYLRNNTTDVSTYFDNALLFPERIWSPWWDNPEGAQSWTPWTVNYDGWTGSTGHGALTCLIGTGSYIFIEWNQTSDTVELVANRLNSVYTGNPGYWARNFIREDLNLDGIIDVFDAVLLSGASGATPGHPKWQCGRADIVCDGIIDVFDAVRISGHAGEVTLPWHGET